MKRINRAISFILSLSLILTAVCFSVCAGSVGAYREVRGDNTRMVLTVGKDETELNFCWHSDFSASLPSVKISKSPDMSNAEKFLGYSVIGDNSQQVNRVTAKGFEENTEYYYTYSSNGKDYSEPVSYKTHSADKFSAVLVSDIQCSATDEEYAQTHAENWNNALGKALEKCPDASFLISAGDQTQTGEDKNEWAATISPRALRGLPVATVIGNHDHKGMNYRYYVNNPNAELISLSKTGTPYYFRYGDVLFVMFNSTCFDVFEAYELAERAVIENSDAKWRVAVFHHDIYGTGHHAADDDSFLLRSAYGEILDKFGFDIALNGHEHLYGRSYNMLDGKIVPLDYSADTVINPDGTLYITAGRPSDAGRQYEEPYNHEWLNYSYMTDEGIYSTVSFDGGKFTLKTYTVQSDRLIDIYSIVKTDFTYPRVCVFDNIFTGTDALEKILSKYVPFLADFIGAIRGIFN